MEHKEKNSMSKRLEPLLERLRNGETVENYKESGNSMAPIIRHREPVTLSPVRPKLLEAGDIVLAKVRGNFYTHLVGAVRGNEVQIKNNRGRVNGWTPLSQVVAIISAINSVPRRSALSKIKKS